MARLPNPKAPCRYIMCCHVQWCCEPQALRILSHSCDAEIDNPDTPLALWDKLEKEVHQRISK